MPARIAGGCPLRLRLRMLAKRIIPCLDVNHGRVVKGTNFVNLKDAGDPVEVAARYDEEGADELVFLDITASHEDRGDPAGRRPPDGRGLFHAADRRRRDSQPRRHPDALERGGRQGLDQLGGRARPRAGPPGRPAVRQPVHRGQHRSQAGRRATAGRSGRSTSTAAGCRPGCEAVAWAREVEGLGAGEIVLTSMDADGTQNGYDLEMTRAVVDAVAIPVVASGGAGNPEHLRLVLAEAGASAALAASIFHYRHYSISETKDYLASRGVPVRFARGSGASPAPLRGSASRLFRKSRSMNQSSD